MAACLSDALVRTLLLPHQTGLCAVDGLSILPAIFDLPLMRASH